MPLLPFGSWLPDLPSFANPGATVATNVVPGPGGYRPLKSLVPANARLAGRCLGSGAFVTSNLDTVMYASDAVTISRMAGSLSGWQSAGAWSDPGATRVEFVKFGDRIVATNFVDPMKSALVDGGGTFADLSTGAPNARHICPVKGFLMAGNTSHATDGERPERIWWSAFNNCPYWPAPGTDDAVAVQSDFQDLLGDGGAVRGIRAGLAGADALVIQDRALQRILYVGAPIVFQIDLMEGGRGTPAPGSVVQVGGEVHYLSDDGFLASNGAASRATGFGKVDRFFYGKLNEGFMDRISGAADPAGKVIYWAFPGPGSTGNPNCMMLLNYEMDEWAFADGIECEILMQSMSVGYTLDDLDAIAPSLDLLPGSLDDRLYAGNTRPIFSAFDTDHTLSYFSGANLAATLETPETQLFDGSNGKPGNAIVQAVYPQIDCATLRAAVAGRDSPAGAVAFDGYEDMTEDGFVPAMNRAKFHRVRIEIPAGAEWSVAQGITNIVAKYAGDR